jgi:hypothetical protein
MVGTALSTGAHSADGARPLHQNGRSINVLYGLRLKMAAERPARVPSRALTYHRRDTSGTQIVSA